MDSMSLSRRSSHSSYSSEDQPMTQNELSSTKDGLISTSKKNQNETLAGGTLDLRYKVDDVPPWYLCVVLGFQHYLTMFGSTASIPLVLAPSLCLNQGSVAVSEILGTIFFVGGLITILQSTFGIRLPIIQGGTFSFLVPSFAILALPKWKCPTEVSNEYNTTLDHEVSFNQTSPEELWKPRICEIQGAIIAASLFQVIIGATGLIGYIMQYIGPLTIAPTITLIGLALFDVAANTSSMQWGIAALTMVLITLFSQYLRNIKLPVLSLKRVSTKDGKKIRCHKSKHPIFKMFPVILAILVVWFLCFILTVTEALPNGNPARTDINSGVLHEAKWFRIPYPFQWGLPTFTWAGTLGMLAGVMAGMLESVGDYYACARMCGAPPPPIHAVNRGIFIEGIGCVLAGMWGSGTGTTSYSENIGAIGITKVGSRRVIQTAGVIMMLLGMFGKFGALFVTIPSPIVGGVFMTMFGMITAVGVSNLQYVNLNSSRNLFIFGFSILIGISVSKWLHDNEGAINTGVDILDQIITVLFSTSMFLGGTVAFVLDNTVPGSQEERGMMQWRKQLVGEEGEEGVREQNKCYDIPFITKCLGKHGWTRHIPVSPTFSSYQCNCCDRNKTADDEERTSDVQDSSTNN